MTAPILVHDSNNINFHAEIWTLLISHQQNDNVAIHPHTNKEMLALLSDQQVFCVAVRKNRYFTGKDKRLMQVAVSPADVSRSSTVCAYVSKRSTFTGQMQYYTI